MNIYSQQTLEMQLSALKYVGNRFKGTNPLLKKSSNIPELYAKMLRTFY